MTLLRNETYPRPDAASYKYKLYVEDDGTYVTYRLIGLRRFEQGNFPTSSAQAFRF